MKKTTSKMLLPLLIASCTFLASCSKSSDQAPTNPADVKSQVNQALSTPVQTAQDANASTTTAPDSSPAPTDDSSQTPDAQPPITVGTETAPSPINPSVAIVRVVITSKADDITLNKLTFNRGNCGVGSWDDRGHHGAIRMRFGDVTKVVAFCNNISEVSVDSDAGSWVFSF